MPVVLTVESIGYLVPRYRFDGSVQSVYRRACNISCGESLLTVTAPDVPDGPTALRLAGGQPIDLRTCFRSRDPVSRCGSWLTSPRAIIDLGRAGTWNPEALREIAALPELLDNLRLAAERLRERCRPARSVVHREGHVVCVQLTRACRRHDLKTATADAARLIGWGEGLTPAGDDFLVGLLAGLEALVRSSMSRRTFLARFSDAIVARLAATTVIAAHALRLAAQGHFNADLHRLRNALLRRTGVGPLRRSMEDVLAAGDTSGSDLCAGLLSGMSAWIDTRSTAAGSR